MLPSMSPAMPASESLARPDGVRVSAWRAVDRLAPKSGEVVLVTGLDRAIGLLAAQLTRLCGARVLGVCPPRAAKVREGMSIEIVAAGPGLLGRLSRAAREIDRCLDIDGTIDASFAHRVGLAQDRIVCGGQASCNALNDVDAVAIHELVEVLARANLVVLPGDLR